MEQAVKINPNYFKACFNLGAAFYDNKQYHKSIAYYNKAVKLNPKDDRSYYGLAASQFVLGQHTDAEINCKKAIQLNPGNTEARTLLQRLKG
jgi:tetratricopeptide (TPR) repeat protein